MKNISHHKHFFSLDVSSWCLVSTFDEINLMKFINFEFKNLFLIFFTIFSDQRSIFEALYTIFLTDKKRNFPFPQPNYSHREEACVVVERVFSPQWFYVRSSGSAIKKRVDAIKQEPDLFKKKKTRHIWTEFTQIIFISSAWPYVRATFWIIKFSKYFDRFFYIFRQLWHNLYIYK